MPLQNGLEVLLHLPPRDLDEDGEGKGASLLHVVDLGADDFDLAVLDLIEVQGGEVFEAGIGLAAQLDSLFTVDKIQTRFYRADCSPVNHDPDNLVRTQDLEPWFEENSNLYIFTRDSFAKTAAATSWYIFLMFIAVYFIAQGLR